MSGEAEPQTEIDPNKFALDWSSEFELKTLGQVVRCLCQPRPYAPHYRLKGAPVGRDTHAFCSLHSEAAYRRHREARALGVTILPDGSRVDDVHFAKLYGTVG